MARTLAPLDARRPAPFRTAKVASTKNHNLKSTFKHARSPLSRAIISRSPIKLSDRQPVSKRNALATKARLYTIREESPDMEHRGERTANEINNMTAGSDGESSDIDSDFEGWDDETTLVAKLQNDAPQASEREQLIALAHQLEGPMKAQGDLLKQYLAHTIAPAAKRVKEVHNILEQKVDVSFGVGVLSFDDACKKIETLALQDEDELKNLYIESQRSVTKLFTQLKAAYDKRNRLWDQLRDCVDKSASGALQSLADIPSALDEASVGIDKRAKDITKTGSVDGKAREQMLRELLASM